MPRLNSYSFGCVALLALLLPHIAQALEVPLIAEETQGYTRRSEVVTLGIPLPRSLVKDLTRLSVLNQGGEAVPAQFQTLATWPDGSTKWVLVDFFADCPANGTAEYRLTDSGKRPEPRLPLALMQEADTVTVETGVLRSALSRKSFDLFDAVQLDHNRDGVFSAEERVSSLEPAPGILLLDPSGREVSSLWGAVDHFEVEARGPVRATLAVKGSLADSDGARFLRYTLRLHFYAGTGLVRAFFTLENPEFATPLTGNHWVLGQPGSRFFEDASLLAHLRFHGPIQMSVGDGPEDILDRVVLTGKGGIYQDSSGGENWFHRNHMDHLGRIPLRFQGAKAFLDAVEPYARKRPDAWLHLADRQFGLAVAVRQFWQNFPKALSAGPDGSVRVSLWPEEFSGQHELQGGEIKTHEIAFFFHTGPQDSNRIENRVATAMGAFHHPLYVRAPAEWYLDSGFFGNGVPYDPKRFPAFENYQQGAVASEKNNLVADIERIDQYGWRNFGDVWAKNETDKTGGPHTGRQVVNHYNLEYDLGYGMLFQSLRTAGTALSPKWWDLAAAALRHESDIDIYHAAGDPRARGVYSGGMFSHTAHGVEAALSTHRGAPRLTWFGSLRWPWGQGSAPESGHFNTRGLLAYYYMTGDRRVLESALELTALVYRKVSEDVFAQIGNIGREAGNNLQILTDAYLLTWDEKYREAAEKILKSTGPERHWYMSAEGREKNPKGTVSFWSPALCVNAAARWTAVMEERTGQPYVLGREYVTRYADFVSRFLAGGPDVGFYSSWSPARGGSGNNGPWTYRIADVVMSGHRYTNDPELKKRCLQAAADAFIFVERAAPVPPPAVQWGLGDRPDSGPIYINEKATTQIIGGGHEYTFFMRHGRWPD